MDREGSGDEPILSRFVTDSLYSDTYPHEIQRYDNWCAIAAFFDGDGTVSASIRKDTVHIKLEFSDNWFPQIVQIRDFLVRQGVATTSIYLSKGHAFLFHISKRDGILLAARAMLNTHCLFKKRHELAWVVDYFEDKITGTDFIERLNDSVRAYNRTGKIRHADIPYVHSVGARQRYLRVASRRRLLSDEQKEQIAIDRWVSGMTYAALSSKYGVSITVVRRALGLH